MRYWFHTQSGSVARLKLVWAQAIGQPDDYWPDDLKKRDRASGIEAGSGDYFIARKKPTKFVSSDGRRPPELTGDVEGYSSDKRNHIIWWVRGGWSFAASLLDLHKPQAHWQGQATHFHMLDTGICRVQSFPTWNLYVATGKDDAPTCKRMIESHFLSEIPTSSRDINLNGWRSDIYNGQFTLWDDTFTFRNGEWHTYRNIADMGMYLNGSAARFESAYVDAWEHLPSVSCNGIANILEAISAIRTAIGSLSNPIGAVSEFAEDLADPRNAWLAYRYQYTTTKMDVEEYVSLWQRMRKLRNMCKHVSVRTSGLYHDETGTYECHCSVEVSTILPEGLNDWLDMCGIKPSVSNLWDMVPYSFVVDWFTKLGDILRGFENWTGSLEFNPKDIWYVYRSSYDNQSVYYRVRGRALGMLPAYHDMQVSGRTIRMRIADAISLFTP